MGSCSSSLTVCRPGSGAGGGDSSGRTSGAELGLLFGCSAGESLCSRCHDQSGHRPGAGVCGRTESQAAPARVGRVRRSCSEVPAALGSDCARRPNRSRRRVLLPCICDISAPRLSGPLTNGPPSPSYFFLNSVQ